MYGANSCWFHKKGHLLTPCSTRRSSPPLKPGTLTTTTPVSFSLMFYMVAEIHESQSFCHAPILSTTPDTATCAPFFTQCPPTLLQNGTPLRVIYHNVSAQSCAGHSKHRKRSLWPELSPRDSSPLSDTKETTRRGSQDLIKVLVI